MKILFDLDGTLIDARKRMYELFNKLAPETNLNFDEYWELKRKKISHKEILLQTCSYSERQIEEFDNKWMDTIETPSWLELDTPIPGVTDFLIAAKAKHLLYIITARQNTVYTLNQIEQFGWSGFFEKVLITNQKIKKAGLIKDCLSVDHADWMIGDTGNDIQTGKVLGMKTAAVLSGFTSKEKLQEYKPDLIIESVVDFNYAVN